MVAAKVFDHYGNNYAVQCEACRKPFIISEMLNGKKGRTCPHCNGSHVTFDERNILRCEIIPTAVDRQARIRSILDRVRPLAVEFYQLTKKPLGVTGEISEFVVAEQFPEIILEAARTEGFDAKRGDEKIQIKGRALNAGAISHHRISRIRPGAECDVVMLVILDRETLDPLGIWEAPYNKIEELLKKSNSKARARGSLSIGEFIKEANKVWPKQD